MDMGRERAVKSWCFPAQYVDLPEPGEPQTISPKGMVEWFGDLWLGRD